MLGALTSLTSGGGLSSSSSATATNGDFQGGNTGFNGGTINFAPSNGAKQSNGINPFYLLAGAVAVYAIFLRKK